MAETRKRQRGITAMQRAAPATTIYCARMRKPRW